MRTIFGFLPALICVGAMAGCARMAMRHAPSNRTPTRVPTTPLSSEKETQGG